MLTFLLFALFLSAGSGPTPDQQARIERLEHKLLAPCCYQEPLATHRSDTASEMRAELAQMVAQGKSDREILDFYKQRYGTRVLVEPEGGSWWVMNAAPVVVSIGGLLFVLRLMRKMLRRPQPRST